MNDLYVTTPRQPDYIRAYHVTLENAEIIKRMLSLGVDKYVYEVDEEKGRIMYYCYKTKDPKGPRKQITALIGGYLVIERNGHYHPYMMIADDFHRTYKLVRNSKEYTSGVLEQ